MPSLNKFLRKMGACGEAVEWAKDYSTLTEAWVKCERADWMTWLIGKMADKPGWPTRKHVVSVACDFAEDVLPIYEKKYPDDKRVRDCIATVRKWVNGETTI